MRQKKQKPLGSANTFSLTPPTKLPSKKTGNPALPLPLAAHKRKTDLLVDPKETFICATIYRYMFLGFQQQKEIHLRKNGHPLMQKCRSCVTKLLEVQNLNFVCIWIDVLDQPHCSPFPNFHSCRCRCIPVRLKIRNKNSKLKRDIQRFA